MVSKPQRPRGRPAEYVKDHRGDPIVGLSQQTNDDRYYATGTKPKVYFGKDFPVALIRFREWQAKQTGATVTFIEERETLNKWTYPPQPTGETHEVQTTIPEDLYIARLRADLSDAARCKLLAEQTGFPLHKLEKFADPPKGLKLTEVWDNYVNKRRPKPLSKSWKNDVKTYWDEFVKMVGAKTTSAITETAVHEYGDKIIGLHAAGKQSQSYVENRFTAVCAVLKCSVGRDKDARRVLDYCLDPQRGLLAPANDDKEVIAISPDQYKAIIDGTENNPKLRAMLLVALNCCYYPGDLAELKVKDIDFDHERDPDIISICNRRAKETAQGGAVPRAACLWDITVNAIRSYQQAEPHDLPTLFATKEDPKTGKRRCYDPKKVSKFINAHIRRRKLAKEITAKSIRKATYTYATMEDDETSDMMLGKAKILAGHSMPGVSDDYIFRNPRHVLSACERVYRAFFENGNGKKTTPKRKKKTTKTKGKTKGKK